MSNNHHHNHNVAGHVVLQGNQNHGLVVNIPIIQPPPQIVPGAQNTASPDKGLLNANSQSYSEIPMLKFSHLWTIKHFNLIPTDLERLCSPWFSPPNQKDLWFLKLRLKAFDESNGNLEFIGVHLFLKESSDKKKEVRAHYTISVLDSLGNKRFTGECSKPEGRIFKAGTEGHGYKLLCPREGIFRPENKLLGDDNSLNIRCEVTVFGDIKHYPPRSQVPLFSPEEKLNRTLGPDISKLYHKEASKDVILKARGGKSIQAHKSILMARSDYFAAMFDHDLKEKKSNEVNLDDVDVDVLDEMVYYMYHDSVRNMVQNVEPLIIAADRFDLDNLKLLCEEHLIPQIATNNVGKLLALADMANASKLKSHCLNFVTDNPSETSECKEFGASLQKRPLLYKEAFEALCKRQKKV